VPLSSGILIAEIALCIISFITPLAKVLGGVIQFFIYIMNTAIERFDQLPFSVWHGMSITIMQAALLTLFIAAISYWLLYKERKTLWTGLVFMLLFLIIRIQSFMEVTHQKKIVVYNVPKYSAIDIMSGRKNYFIGDTELIRNELLHNFHIKPSRIMHRLYADSVLHVNAISINGKTIMILRKSFQFPTIPNKTNIDLLILSQSPKLLISTLAHTFLIQQIVIDGSVPKWQSMRWKKESDSLKIPCFNVSEKGAFVMNL
jgi:competence protein ComEC